VSRLGDTLVVVSTIVAVLVAAVLACALARWAWLILVEVAREIVFQLRMRGVIR
jgi:hypothetical protein